MRLLLDTSVFIYLTTEPQAIPLRIRKAINVAETVALSVASAWEIAIKSSVGKLKLALSADEWVRSRAAQLDVTIEPVRLDHATQVEILPLHHRDPFDRLLIAVAALDGYTIVTQDRHFAKYTVRLLPAWK